MSSKRVSYIRARQYKSKGEKVTFRHTPSRERLLTSQELALASGFQHVQLLPNGDYQPLTMGNAAINSTEGRVSVLSSSEFATGRKKKKVRGGAARKNLLLLSNQGGSSRPATQTSNSFYQ